MPSRRLEDRIRHLCRSAVTANNAELDRIFSALNSALREHAERLRKLMILKLTTRARVQTPERRTVAELKPLFASGQTTLLSRTTLAASWGLTVDPPDMQVPPAPKGRTPSQSEAVRCSICDLFVPLEIAKSDEYGRAIHEECYALKMQLKRATTPPAA